MGSGLELSSGPTKAKAEQEIKGFMAGMFYRDLHPEETDLTAQVLHGLSGPVATQVSHFFPFQSPKRTQVLLRGSS